MRQYNQANNHNPSVASSSQVNDDIKAQVVTSKLKELGVSKWGLLKSETHYLPKLMHPNENLGGVIYGHSNEGSVMMAATDRRIIYIDKKPLFVRSEDISYEVISGITLEWVGFHGAMILHTRFGDIKIRTMNRRAAEKFRDYVDSRCIEIEPDWQNKARKLVERRWDKVNSD